MTSEMKQNKFSSSCWNTHEAVVAANCSIYLL